MQRFRSIAGVLGLLSGLGLLAGCASSATPNHSPTVQNDVNRVSGSASRIGTSASNVVRAPSTAMPRRNRRNWNRGRTGAAVTAESLTTLPRLSYVKALNPWLRNAHQISTFSTQMGYHWATPIPGMVVMTNNNGQVTAVEASFPQRLGSFPWYDPPTTVPNSGVAFRSEHLYFVAPTSITSTMSASMTTDLSSWKSFEMVNPRLSSYAKTGRTYDGFSVYAPSSGPSVDVLVASGGRIAGFMTEEPANWGWHPEYRQPKGKPMHSRIYGSAYYSTVLLLPPHTR